jgi:transcriptional regulator with XRE-family HTH domain
VDNFVETAVVSELRDGYNAGVPTLAENLSQLRERGGLSQTDVAARVGVSRKQVNQWENGAAEPQPANVQALAQFFGVSVPQLRGDEALPSASPPPVVQRWTIEQVRRELHAIVDLLDEAGLGRIFDVATREHERFTLARRSQLARVGNGTAGRIITPPVNAHWHEKKAAKHPPRTNRGAEGNGKTPGDQG